MAPAQRDASARRTGDPNVSTALIGLQQTAGNAAVARLLEQLNESRGAAAEPNAIPQPARARLEHAFGVDLSSVRVQRDASHVAAAGSRATTTGKTIAFAPGQFAPETPQGFRLLAHETAHVVQQTRAASLHPDGRSVALEADAWAAADAALAGRPSSVVASGAVPATQAADTLPVSPLEGRPFAIEMEWTPGLAQTSELQFKRDPKQFWRKYAEKWPEHLSAENQARINGKPFQAPHVDKQWTKYYPQDVGFENDILEHGHAGQGSRAVALPKKLHDAYTAVHPKREIVGEPTKPPPEPTKPLPPQPTRAESVKEIARHTEAKRMGEKFPPGKPPPAPDIPAGSELTSVAPAERRPIDPSGQRVIGGKTYPGERAISEARYPPQKYSPPAAPASPMEKLLPPDPKGELVIADWGEPSELSRQLKSTPSRGGKTIPLGRLSPGTTTQGPPAGGHPIPAAAAPKTGFIPPTKVTPPTVLAEPAKVQPPAPARRVVSPLSSSTLAGAQVARAKNVGTVVGLGAGLLAGYGLDKYREWLEETVAKMPPPKADRRPLQQYLTARTGPMRILDLFSKDMDAFATSVEQAGQEVAGKAYVATLLLGLSSRTPTERIDALAQLDDYVGGFQDELFRARRGIDAALELEPLGQERIEAAASLADLILQKKPTVRDVFVWDQLVKMGFSIEEILAIHANLLEYAGRVRRVFRELHELQERTDRVFLEVTKFASKLNSLYWSEVFQLARSAKSASVDAPPLR